MDALVDRGMYGQKTSKFFVFCTLAFVVFYPITVLKGMAPAPMDQGGVAPAPAPVDMTAMAAPAPAMPPEQMVPSVQPVPSVEPLPQPVQAPADAFVPSPVVVSQPGAAGPNTVDSSGKIGVQGNWVKKREWLIKAHELNNELQDLADKVEPIRKTFSERYSSIDTVLDTYYKSAGLGQGKIEDLFEDIMRYLEKKRKRALVAFNLPATQERPDTDTQAKIELVEDEIKEARQQLEQLKLNMKSIEDLEHSLTDRMKRLEEQSNQIAEEADRASKIAEDMWDIIDHNKARDSFYQIKVSSEKIKNIQAYLSEDLSKDFDTVIETIKSQIQQTQDQVKKLEDNGFFIKNRAERVKEAKAKKIEEEKKKKKEAIAAVARKIVATPAPTFWSRITDMVSNLVKNSYVAFVWIKNKIWPSGAKVVASARTEQTQVAQPSSSQTASAVQQIPAMPEPAASSATQQPSTTTAATPPPAMSAPAIPAQPGAPQDQNQPPAMPAASVPAMPAAAVPAMPPAGVPTA